MEFENKFKFKLTGSYAAAVCSQLIQIIGIAHMYTQTVVVCSVTVFSQCSIVIVITSMI